MKQILLVLFVSLIMLTGCRTKHVLTTQRKETQQAETFRKLDSLAELSLSLYKQIQTENLLENTRFELRTTIDTNGISQPLEYTHEVDGEVKEKITLSGGSLIRSKDSKNQINNQINKEKKNEKNTISSDNKYTENQSIEIKDKDKKVESNGGTFGMYISFIVITVILAVLAFLKWRLKLF